MQLLAVVLAAATASAQSCDTYDVLATNSHGRNIIGGDDLAEVSVDVSSAQWPDACCTACDTTPGCTGWQSGVYNWSTGCISCILKGGNYRPRLLRPRRHRHRRCRRRCHSRRPCPLRSLELRGDEVKGAAVRACFKENLIDVNNPAFVKQVLGDLQEKIIERFVVIDEAETNKDKPLVRVEAV